MHLLHRARLATWLLFCLNGVLYACWAAHIPQLSQRFALDHQTLGLALLTVTLGSLISLRLTSGLLHRWSSGVAGLLGLTVMTAGLLLTLLVPSLPLLFLAILLVGAGFAITDLAMNRAGAQIETQLQTPIMSGLHGAFSVGMMVGAGVSSLLLGWSVALLPTYLGLGLLVLLGAVLTLPLHERQVAAIGQETSPAQATRAGGFVTLLVLGLCAAVIEGVINDWSALFMDDVLGSSAEAAPLALAAFGLTMMVGRLIGDRLTQHLGVLRLSVAANLAMMLGLGLILLAHHDLVGLLGFALAGLGLSVLAPLTFSAAGRHPDPRALPVLISTFYTGFLIGPAAMGVLSQGVGLHAAFLLPLALALLSTVLWFTQRAPNASATPRSPYSTLT